MASSPRVITSQIYITAQNQTAAAFQSAAASMRQLAGQAEHTARAHHTAFGEMAKGVTGFHHQLNQLGAGLALGHIAREAWKVAGEWEDSQRRIQDATKATPHQMHDLEEAIKQTAQSFGASGNALAAGAEKMAQAGIPIEEIAGHLRNLAAASLRLNVPLERLGPAVLSSAKTMGFAEKDMGRFLDMIGTAKSPQALIDALPELGRAAAAAGQTGERGFSNLLGVWNAMVKQFGEGPEALAMSTMLMEAVTQSHTEKQRDKWIQHGIVIKDVMLKAQRDGMNPLQALFLAVEARVAETSRFMGESMNEAWNRVIPDPTEQAAIRSGLANIQKDFEDSNKRIQQGFGNTEREANKANLGAAGSTRQLTAAWDELLKTVGESGVKIGVADALLNFAKDINDEVVPAIEKVVRISDALQRLDITGAMAILNEPSKTTGLRAFNYVSPEDRRRASEEQYGPAAGTLDLPRVELERRRRRLGIEPVTPLVPPRPADDAISGSSSSDQVEGNAAADQLLRVDRDTERNTGETTRAVRDLHRFFEQRANMEGGGGGGGDGIGVGGGFGGGGRGGGSGSSVISGRAARGRARAAGGGAPGDSGPGLARAEFPSEMDPMAPAGTRPISGAATETITTSGGRKFTVAKEFAENFRGFLNDYEKAGGVIGPSSGGVGSRPGNPSYHPLGRAIDLNQVGYGIRSNTGKTLPRITEERLAKKWGLFPGSQFSSRSDIGHFEVRNAAAARRALEEVQRGTSAPTEGPGAAPAVGGTGGGMTRGDMNRNPGNLKYNARTAAMGATGQDEQGHAIFPTVEAGRAAMEATLRNRFMGKSIAEMNRSYAEDPNWKNNVAKRMGVSPDYVPKPDEVGRLADAIQGAEGTRVAPRPGQAPEGGDRARIDALGAPKRVRTEAIKPAAEEAPAPPASATAKKSAELDLPTEHRIRVKYDYDAQDPVRRISDRDFDRRRKFTDQEGLGQSFSSQGVAI